MPGSDCQKSGLKWVPFQPAFLCPSGKRWHDPLFYPESLHASGITPATRSRFCRNAPFVIPFGCAVPFFRTRPFARERLSRFAGGVGSRRFSFASFFPSFPSLFCPDGPDAADTDASRTPFTRPSFDGPSADAVPRSVRWHTIFCRFHATRGRFAYPASMFFPGSRRNVLHSCRWAVGSFQIRECRCSLFSPPFPRPFSVEVAPSFFAAKLGCRRARPVRS